MRMLAKAILSFYLRNALFIYRLVIKQYTPFEIIQQVEVDLKYNTTTKATTTIIGEAAIKLIRSLDFRKC
jgi:hypothetical protein